MLPTHPSRDGMFNAAGRSNTAADGHVTESFEYLPLHQSHRTPRSRGQQPRGHLPRSADGIGSRCVSRGSGMYCTVRYYDDAVS